MPLYLDDTFYLEAPLKAYVKHDKITKVVKTSVNLAGTGRAIFASLTLNSAGTWRLIGHGRFTHPEDGNYLYTWISKSSTFWNTTQWNEFLEDENLKASFQAVKVENSNDYIDIHINAVVSITEQTTFDWCFSTNSSTSGTFFDAVTASSNLNINSLPINQAFFSGIKLTTK